MKKIISLMLTVLILTSCLNISLFPADAARTGAVNVENVTSMPAKVKVSSFTDFKKKLATAINLKKTTITIETSKYNSKDYSTSNLDNFFSEVNFELCYSKGYSTTYYFSWNISGNSAKYTFKFTYKDISEDFRTATLKKARNVGELNKIIKEAALKKSYVISIALTNCRSQKYTLKSAVLQANDEEVLSKGYHVTYKAFDGLDINNNQLVNLYLEYYDPDNNPSATSITSYEQFNTTVSNVIKDKDWKFVFAIENYDSEKYNLGDTLLKLNKEVSANYGYCARVSFKTIKSETPTVMEVHLDYEKLKPGEYVSDKDRNLPIYKNEKEWYRAIKNAVINYDKTMAYNITYSQDFDDVISLVLDQNPDINYVKELSTYSDGKIVFQYKFADDDLTVIKERVNSKATEILAHIIKPEMTETEKAKAIHDYLVLNSTYDYDNYKKDTVPGEGYTAYGILINGSGVCQGYAGAFKLLANMAGIKCIGVSGDARGRHAWNMAILDGKVAYIDVTWDDPVPDKGNVYYDYFNISETQMSKDHEWDKNIFCEKYIEYLSDI